MNKPSNLVDLLDDLKTGHGQTSVTTLEEAWAKIYLPNSNDPIFIGKHEAELLFNTTATVQLLVESFDDPADATLEVHGLVFADEVQDCLERLFAAVDEN